MLPVEATSLSENSCAFCTTGSRSQRALTANAGEVVQHIRTCFVPSPHLQNLLCEVAYQKCKLLDIVSI